MDPETDQIRRFLLGELTTPAEDWDAETIGMIETELIDQYLRGELAGEELRQFQSNYLSRAENGRKVQMAAALQRYLAPRRKSRWRIAGWVSAAAATLAVIVYWHVSAITLYPGSVREPLFSSAEISKVVPRPIRLAIIDRVPAGAVRAVLRNPEGEVWRTDTQIEPNAEYLTIVLPTWQIPKGSYSIELQVVFDGQSRTVASYRITID